MRHFLISSAQVHGVLSFGNFTQGLGVTVDEAIYLAVLKDNNIAFCSSYHTLTMQR